MPAIALSRPSLRIASLLLAALAGCRPPTTASARPTPAESRAIGDSLRAIVRTAYDLSVPDVPSQMLSIYPAEGRVISATAGRVTTTRELLGDAVESFWEGVGRLMVRPTWTWDAIQIDVLSRDVAVMTAQYTVPHWTYEGAPHVIGGVWSAVWEHRDGRWMVTHEHLSDIPRTTAESIEATMPSIAPTPLPDTDSTASR